MRQGDSISTQTIYIGYGGHVQRAKLVNQGYPRILINGKRISHLRFADDITLIARDQDELQSMIKELNEKSEQIGLKTN